MPFAANGMKHTGWRNCRTAQDLTLIWCSKQRRAQNLVAQFNADERLWERLEGKRRLRRRLYPRSFENNSTCWSLQRRGRRKTA
jgi:hypothetical protein